MPNRYGAGLRRAVFSKFDSSAAEHFFVFSLIPRHCRCCCCCYRFPHAHFVFLFTTQPAFLSCDVCRVYLLKCACNVYVCAKNTRPVACKIQIKKAIAIDNYKLSKGTTYNCTRFCQNCFFFVLLCLIFVKNKYKLRHIYYFLTLFNHSLSSLTG